MNPFNSSFAILGCLDCNLAESFVPDPLKPSQTCLQFVSLYIYMKLQHLIEKMTSPSLVAPSSLIGCFPCTDLMHSDLQSTARVLKMQTLYSIGTTYESDVSHCQLTEIGVHVKYHPVFWL